MRKTQKRRGSLRVLFSAFISVCLALTVFTSTSCAEQKKRYTDTYLDVFDTVTTFSAYAKGKDEFDALSEKVHATLSEYHRLFDIYNEYEGINNLMTVNKNAGISSVRVDARIIGFLSFCKEMYDLTGGMTNVAMGSVLSVWHDAREASDGKDGVPPPDISLLCEKNEHTDIKCLVIDAEKGEVYLSDSEMSLDVGAVAKGYAAEAVGKYLDSLGINAILSVGGNIRTVGDKNGEAWRVGISDPSDPSKNICFAGISGKSLVTSGSYMRYFTYEGVRYHHIISPETLYPKDTFVSVSVICSDSGLADTLSTALFNMSEEDGKKLVASLSGVEVMWVRNDGSIVFSDGAESFVTKK